MFQSLPADNPLGWDAQFTSSGRRVVIRLHRCKFCPELFVLFSFTVGCGAPASMKALTAPRSREVSMWVTNIGASLIDIASLHKSFSFSPPGVVVPLLSLIGGMVNVIGDGSRDFDLNTRFFVVA